jgi:hypothetical protein
MGRLGFVSGIFALVLLSLSVFSAEFENVRTFTAGEAIATPGLRVKLSGVTVVKAGSAEDDIGSVIAPVASSGLVGVKLARTGTSMMIANGVIAAGTAVYPAAAGKIGTGVAGHRIGITLTASGADGDAVEVIRVPFTLSTAGDVTIEAGRNLSATGGAGAVDFSGMTGTFATPTGAGTISGTTTIAANKNLLCAAGTTAVDLSLGTGAFKTTTGAHTINGAVTLAADKGIAYTAGTGAADFSNGSGVFKTTTGAVTIGSGAVTVTGDMTVAAGKVLGVTDGGSASVSTGVGSVKMSTASAANNSKWIPIQYAGVTYYVPAWTTHAP